MLAQVNYAGSTLRWYRFMTSCRQTNVSGSQESKGSGLVSAEAIQCHLREMTYDTGHDKILYSVKAIHMLPHVHTTFTAHHLIT